jgi:hypothetical protein
LSDESKKASVGRRSLLLAGTALPVLPISGAPDAAPFAAAQHRGMAGRSHGLDHLEDALADRASRSS